MNFDTPGSFASELGNGSHTLLLYEDKMKANQIRLDFIKDGLENNQSCVYITTESDGAKFEKSLREKNLDMDKVKGMGIFHVYNIDNPFTNFGGFSKSIDKIWNDLSKKIKSPMRIACNIVGDVANLSENQIEDLLDKESCIHSTFAKSEDYLLCTYFVGNVGSETSSKFLEAIKHHDSVMFAPLDSDGIGFNLD